MSRFLHSILAVTALLLVGFMPGAQAAAPQAQTQVPGFYRLSLGQFEVTALFDGALELDTKLLKNASASDYSNYCRACSSATPKCRRQSMPI